MRLILTLFTTAALLATPAFAHARGFDSNLPASVTGPIKLEIVVSDDLAHRANNLPSKSSDRRSRRLGSSFANNGHYGDREIEFLIENMSDEILGDFAKRGITLSDTAATTLRVTIVDAKPNRPTFNQLSEDPSLSYQSFGAGGTEVTAEIISASGEVIGEADYDYYASLNDFPIGQAGTWSDAQRAFSRFSKTLSKKLAAAGAAGAS